MTVLDVNVCPVCGGSFVPRTDKGPAGFIYCTSRCAWSGMQTPDGKPRSEESLRREIEAVKKVLEQKPS